jgi:thiol-disulfide isomerase/thioredoxin
MNKIYTLIFLLNLHCLSLQAQQSYRAVLKRADGFDIVFNILESRTAKGVNWVIKNADERIQVTDIRPKGDSLLVNMPFFEAELLLKKNLMGFEGQWKKVGSKGDVYMPVIIQKGADRVQLSTNNPTTNISGRWKTTFVNPDGKRSMAIAEFSQVGNKLKGTFLTPTGDYRFLEGSIAGDSLALTTFDGTHAFYFGAKVDKQGKIVNGVFASGPTYLETWEAIKDLNVELDGSEAVMKVRDPNAKLNFRFLDLDSNWVSINDQRFQNKVVVIQIMGSWCPNCMDETAFLSDYYRKNKDRGVEMIGLAYEYSLDFAKARKSLSRFRDKFKVEYPMLITGVTSSDELRTEKTLPQMTPIKAFPSMIILGRDGKVIETHAGYEGPATGIHHEKFKKEFSETIDQLLKQ